MRKQSFSLIAILILFIALYPQQVESKAAGSLLTLDKGARAAALAGALVASPAAGPFGFVYNPAGLAFQDGLALGFEHNEWGQDMRGEYLSAAYPLSQGTVAAALDYFSYGPLQMVDEYGVLSGDTFNPYLLGLKTGYGLQVTPSMALGLELGFYQESIKTYTDTGGALTVGALWQAPWQGVDLGLAVRNVGATSSGYSLPASGVVGCSFSNVVAKQLDVYLELGFPWVDPGVEVALAAEYQALSWAVVRVGYRHSFQALETAGLGLSGGLGFQWQDWQLSYAIKPMGEFGLTHQLSVEYALKPTEKKTVLTEPEKKVESQSAVAKTQSSQTPATAGLPKKLDTVVQKRFDMGLKQYVAGNYKAAIDEWKLVLDLDPTHALSKEHIQKAEKEWQAALENHRQKARAARSKKDLIGEIQNWKKALVLSPGDTESRQGLDLAQKNAPEMIRAFYNDGLDYYSKGYYKEAIQAWEKVIVLDPQHYKAIENIQKTKEKLIKID